jgi:hypothetical protein
MTIHKATTKIAARADADRERHGRAPMPRRHARLWRGLAPLVVITGILALPTSAVAGGFKARLFLATHQPKVGAQPIKVTATRGRQKLSGSVSYQFLFNGLVVSHKPGHGFRNGVFTDKLLWPKRAVGHTITLRVVVKTRYGTDYLNWWIKVRA